MKPISAKTIPGQDPVPRLLSLQTLRAHCEVVTIDVDSDGVTSNPDDDLLLAYLDAATDHAEKFTGRALRFREFEFALDEFPETVTGELAPGIEIPYPPLVGITSLTYTDDSDGELEPDVDYTVDDYGDKAVLRTISGWPAMTEEANRIRCRYWAGYQSEEEPDTDSTPLPGAIKAALLLMVDDLYANRGQVTPECLAGIEALLRPWRVLLGMA